MEMTSVAALVPVANRRLQCMTAVVKMVLKMIVGSS